MAFSKYSFISYRCPRGLFYLLIYLFIHLFIYVSLFVVRDMDYIFRPRN